MKFTLCSVTDKLNIEYSKYYIWSYGLQKIINKIQYETVEYVLTAWL